MNVAAVSLGVIEYNYFRLSSCTIIDNCLHLLNRVCNRLMTYCICWANWKLPGGLQYCCADSANTLRIYRLLQETVFDWTLSMQSTGLQAGRSRVRFPMVSLKFFIDIFLAVALWPWGRLSLSWGCGWESFRGHGCLFLVNVVLSARGLCVGLITRPEECYRVCSFWGWSWSRDHGEALAH